MAHSYDVLKTRQRAERDGWPEFLALRVHRALSWLNRAEQCEDDDGRFVFLWILFNAPESNREVRTISLVQWGGRSREVYNASVLLRQLLMIMSCPKRGCI